MTGPADAARKTRIVQVDPKAPDRAALRDAADVLAAGGLVAFPTETVYGLGANALDAHAVAGIFRAKGRPADNPLIVHVADPSWVDDLAAEVPEEAKRLMARFWPGALTLVLPKRDVVPDITTGGLDTVAVRMPAHPVARALIAAADVPVAAPSANRSGSPSPTRADHVLTDLEGRIDVIVDGGPCRIGVESTVVDVRSDPATILRPGGIPMEALSEVLGVVMLEEGGGALGAETVARAPGMKYRHYAPRAEVRLVEGDPETRTEKLRAAREALAAEGRHAGFLVTDDAGLSGPDVVSLGSRDDPEGAARRLFAALRDMDDRAYDVILVEAVDPAGLGHAVLDRMRRAAEGRSWEA